VFFGKSAQGEERKGDEMEKEKQNPFERYAGIGTPGIGKGRAAIQRWLREMRDGVDAKPPKKRKRKTARGPAKRKLR
jgi:hypothetical protein